MPRGREGCGFPLILFWLFLFSFLLIAIESLKGKSSSQSFVEKKINFINSFYYTGNFPAVIQNETYPFQQ